MERSRLPLPARHETAPCIAVRPRATPCRGPLDRHSGATHRADAYRREASRSPRQARRTRRSEEHTSELQSLMRISYAVFCLKKKKTTKYINTHKTNNITHVKR